MLNKNKFSASRCTSANALLGLCILCRRYKAFRDNSGNYSLFYWELLAVRLGFIIAFEVRRAAQPLVCLTVCVHLLKALDVQLLLGLELDRIFRVSHKHGKIFLPLSHITSPAKTNAATERDR